MNALDVLIKDLESELDEIMISGIYAIGIEKVEKIESLKKRFLDMEMQVAEKLLEEFLKELNKKFHTKEFDSKELSKKYMNLLGYLYILKGER